MNDVAGKRVTVMGLGRFGGGLGVTRWLLDQGASVLVTDRLSEQDLGQSVRELEGSHGSADLRLRLGEHRESDFADCDLLVANPAVPRPWENSFIHIALEAGAVVTTEIGLLVERLPDRTRVVGITGSAGKSTTAAMAASALRHAGRPTHLGGNIGGSLLGALGSIGSTDAVVLELSSAMLHWLEGWSPGVAVLTNLSPNHLDWHGSLEHYEASKRRILDAQRAGDRAVVSEMPEGWAVRRGVEVTTVQASDAVAGLAVPGSHNARNAAMAIAACAALDASLERERLLEGVRSFPGLPHRLRLLGKRDGVRFYDDSKSTTPEATVLALRSFGDADELDRVHLIAGGYDKRVDLGAINEHAAGTAGLYTIGATGPHLAAASEHGRSCVTLERAVTTALGLARPGDIVLLSPGCASWDQFTNFEARGVEFARLAGFGARPCNATRS